MLKYEFLGVLQRELYNLPPNEIKEQLNFYSEMIDDGIEEGLSEEEVVAKIGSISEILSQINCEKTSYSNNKTQENASSDKKKTRLNAKALALIIAGSPVWISLLAAAFSVVITLYAALISLIAGLWSVWILICATEITLAVSSFGGVLVSILFIAKGTVLSALFVLGASLVCAGLSVFLWYGCKYTLFAFVKLTVWSFSKSFSWVKYIRR